MKAKKIVHCWMQQMILLMRCSDSLTRRVNDGFFAFQDGRIETENRQIASFTPSSRGDHTPKYAQGYFDYDSKKSGGYTCSHLRFGDVPIKAPYLVSTPDFVACHVPSYLSKYNVLEGIKQNGTLLLNSLWDEEETLKRIPDNVRAIIAQKNISVYIINATKIAAEIGLGGRTNTILQSAFFKITGVIPYEDAVAFMKKAIVKSYGKKGENIVNMNYQ